MDNVEIPPSPLSNEFTLLFVNNIKNAIPLIPGREKVKYSNRVEFFGCHAHPFNVLDHIDPNTHCPTVSKPMWKRLDSIVK